ncbi:hypothetical protein QYE76_001734 [Lolium multiflorum]|uniref:Membrane magnesium transporter n=2 Tax=Lolium TaxID=4520 RepID=A0AAD8RLQ7_LOLMU|nr:hypothetical protein QYE76_001734 [Lolium multiflorum]
MPLKRRKHRLPYPAPPVSSHRQPAQHSRTPRRIAQPDSGSGKQPHREGGRRSSSPRLASAMGIGYVLGAIGGALLVHAAYATIQYRAVLKITEEEFSHPPFDVIIQLLVGLALCMWAGVSVPAKFLSVLPHSEENRIVSLPANLDFMIFNHRGRALPSDADLKLKI